MENEEEILVNPLEQLDFEEETVTPTPTKEEDNSNQNESDQEEELSPKELRHQQQEEGRVAEVLRLRNMVIDAEVDKASVNGNSLLELHAKDPKLAEEVSKRFWFANYKEAKQSIKPVEEETKVKPTEDQFEERYQARKAKEEHETALTTAQAIIDDLPEDVRDEAIELFNDLIDGKTLTTAKAKKYAEMATLTVNKGKSPKLDTTEWLRKLSTTGISKSNKAVKEDNQMIIFDGEEIFLNSNTTK